MQVHVEHGKSLVFGKDGEKGLRMKSGLVELEVVTIGENGVTESDILIHDETNKMLAMMLSSMEPPHSPVALGVIYCDPTTDYDKAVYDQIDAAKAKSSDANLNARDIPGRSNTTASWRRVLRRSRLRCFDQWCGPRRRIKLELCYHLLPLKVSRATPLSSG